MPQTQIGIVFAILDITLQLNVRYIDLRISGNLVVKSKLPPQGGSSLEAVEPHPWKGEAIKIDYFFLYFLFSFRECGRSWNSFHGSLKWGVILNWYTNQGNHLDPSHKMGGIFLSSTCPYFIIGFFPKNPNGGGWDILFRKNPWNF